MDVDEIPSSQMQPSQPFLDVRAREREFNELYPNRPKNKHPTLPFHSLYLDLFNPLISNKKPPAGRVQSRAKLGPDAGLAEGSHEKRRAIISRYISRWRQEVGNDFFPAMRLILPEKDRDRAMYGLKEKALGKYLVKIMKIDKNSEDGFSLLHWKVPGKHVSSAGDFATRCYDVLQKRPYRTEPGHMNIEEVNEELDNLSAAQKEETQLPILTRFYRQMNAEELMWLIRIILRQMKISATEKTVMNIFHEDADDLFNVSSSLRRVCWELYDDSVKLEKEHKGVTLMQCFQPQLAQFNSMNFAKMVEYLRRYATDDDKEFWIEEKLDGERMQMHMQRDPDALGGFSFRFFSRKAKDYTYLYGKDLYDDNSSLTRHLTSAFAEGVDNIILDGEMITWDPETDRQAAFGTLKTAAISEQNNPYAGKERPLFRIFDILLLNDTLLTQYTLRDRRRALEQAVKPVHRRFEIHSHSTGLEASDIEPHLRIAVETAAEGLVVKNPRSVYTLADRNNDWIKVKPEYMQNYGESLDCLVIGGYYGSGKRGGFLSSFLCGLRANKKSKQFLSFFKVGGGMAATDYQAIQYATEGKWHDWDRKKPPTEYVKLAGTELSPKERPDMWIKPEDSIVVEAKAASVGTSDEFATKLTLRFPRFKRMRRDRSWEDSLTVDEFYDLKQNADRKTQEFEAEKKKKGRKTGMARKKVKVVGGYDEEHAKMDVDAVVSSVFSGMTFFVVTEAIKQKKSKIQLEELIKKHGGRIVQTNHVRVSRDSDRKEEVHCIADRRNVKAASLEKAGDVLLIRPQWLFDCIAQAKRDEQDGIEERVLLFEPERHLFFIPKEEREAGVYGENVDRYGDAFYRDTSVEELKELLGKIEVRGKLLATEQQENLVASELLEEGTEMKGWLFKGTRLFFDDSAATTKPANGDTSDETEHFTDPEWLKMAQAKITADFAGAEIADGIDDADVSHIVVRPDGDVGMIRKKLAGRKQLRIPNLVTALWVSESWKEGTLLDEERFVP